MKPQREFLFRAGAMAFAALFASAPLAAQSLPETIEAIEHARVTTRILFITAHPDDEWSGLLTYLSRGLGADVALLTLTRGQGGQNAIGPEQGEQMGMVRTAELLAADRHYGVRQFFTRAPDFGYSKSPDETLKRWGDLPLEDMVRVIRTFRPEIVINGWGGVHGGHGQHQASGILTPRAVAVAADPGAFPHQLAEGLQPWQAAWLVELAREDTAGALRIPSDQVSPLWGKSYTELGLEGRALHRSQGVTAFFDSPFFRQPIYLQPVEGGKLSLSVLAEALPSLAERFPALRPTLEPTLRRADQSIEAARRSALSLRWTEATEELARAGAEVAGLTSRLSAQAAPEAARALWETGKIGERIDAALADALALHLSVRADHFELVAGEKFSVRVGWSFRKDTPLEIQKLELVVPAGWTATSEKEEAEPAGIRFAVSIPAGAKTSASPGDAILPWPPPLVRAKLTATTGGYTFTSEEPAVAIRATSTSVETYPLVLVPAISLTVEPQQIMLREKRAPTQPPRGVELLARVRYYSSSPAKVEVGVDAPPGWSVAPPAPLEFSGPGDRLVRFHVTPPEHPAEGAYLLKPYGRRDNELFRTSVEPLPSLPARLWTEPANATVRVLDLAVPEDLRIGYVAAANDPLPEALRQLGIHVDLLDEIALAFDDLRRYDAIAIGIRAYELRGDLARANQRLLDYVAQGGTLVVQYQHTDVWNRLSPAPFPATMPRQTSRTTDENSPVRFVAPTSPLLNFPNKIALEDFNGWVQERGLYYWGKFDPRYQAVLALRDPGEDEALGSLVSARDGRGWYIYTGLSFFRQLPAGVPGAYRLFVNLLSQSRLGGRDRQQ